MSNQTLERLIPWAAVAAIAVILLVYGGPDARRMATNVAAVTVFYGAVFLMLVQTIAARWWTSEVGRHLFTFAAAIAVMSGQRCLALIFGDGYPGQDWIRLAGLTAVAIGCFWRVSIMIREVMLRIARDAREAAELDGHHHPNLQSVDRVG